MTTIRGARTAAILLALLSAASVQAYPGGWGPAWGRRGGGGWNDSIIPPNARHSRDPREGQVDVSRFVVKGPQAEQLGHGPVGVTSEAGDGPWVEPGLRRTFEAAIVDALVGAGYDTRHPEGPQPQMATLRISRQVLTPAEEKRSPVSGTAAMEVGTRGSAYGLGINVDLTKPRTALVSTRLDARIVDKASGAVLWEGYATIATREGDSKWTDGNIATKLATALFDEFPKADAIDAKD